MSSEYIGKRENEEETVIGKRQEVIGDGWMGKGLTNVLVMVTREKRKRQEKRWYDDMVIRISWMLKVKGLRLKIAG